MCLSWTCVQIIGMITAKQNAFDILPTSNLKYAIFNPLILVVTTTSHTKKLDPGELNIMENFRWVGPRPIP